MGRVARAALAAQLVCGMAAKGCCWQGAGQRPRVPMRSVHSGALPSSMQTNLAFLRPYALQLLRHANFFKELSEEQLAVVVTKLNCSVYEEGEAVITEGELGDDMYILFDGEAKAYVHGEGGEELMVKHYRRPGEYFGELSLLYSSIRRATVRAASAKTHVLRLSRQCFESEFGPYKELVLRNAAFRPAAKVVERAEERASNEGPLARLLGISGDERQLAVSSLAYLCAGTAFYTWSGFEDFEKTSVVAGFYYTVQAGLAVGFGKLTPRSELAPFFTSGFVVAGAALLANFLSTVVADSLQGVSRLGGGSPVSERQRAGPATLLLTASPLLGWWLVGIAYGTLHEGWGWGASLLFAVSCTSSVGLQGLESSDDLSLLFCAVYCLVGVPLYTLVLGRFTLLIAESIVRRRQEEIQTRALDTPRPCRP